MMKFINLFFIILFCSIYGCSISKPAEICSKPGEKILINKIEIIVKNACTTEDSRRGLMDVKFLRENGGMFFVFGKETFLTFWMKNTYIPLDVAYINDNFEIVDIHTMIPHDETPVVSKAPASYALEVNANFFNKNNIKIGDKVYVLID